MEMDSNTDSSMSIMDSNINSSARFLVQFHTENRPYREQFAEHHGSVADFDIETANPYLVEMHTSGFLPKFMGSGNKTDGVKSPLTVGKGKGSSPPGAAEEAKNTVDSKKEVEDAKKAAKQAIVLANLEQKRVKQNKALELRQKQNEAYRRQMQKQEMERNNSQAIAGNFTHGRNPVRANTPYGTRGSMRGAMKRK